MANGINTCRQAGLLIVLLAGGLVGGCRTPTLGPRAADDHEWDAIRLNNGVARAVVVPGIARVMAFERVGGPNLLWQNEALYGKPPILEGADWQNFGGSKLWAAPQAAWGWPPDFVMDQGPCTFAIASDGSVKLEGRPSEAVGVRFDRELRLAPDRAVLHLDYTMQNTTTSNVSWGIWNVIQVKGGGRVLLPAPEEGRIWEDERWKIWEQWKQVGDVFVLHHTGQEGKVMSIGPEGWMAYEKDGEVLVVSFEPDPDAKYPEGHGCAEIYAGGSYVELEHVAPQTDLAPGESTQTSEQWMLFTLEGAQLTDTELAARVRRMLLNRMRQLRCRMEQ